MSVNPRKHREEIEKPNDKNTVIVQSHSGDQAPVLYFDGAVAYGALGAIVQIELATTIVVPVSVNGKSEIRTRNIVVAHLRASHAVMAQLADAIEKALMLTGPLDRNALPSEKKSEQEKVN